MFHFTLSKTFLQSHSYSDWQVKGGIAEADGRLLAGDQILSVNGEDLKNATQDVAAAVLKVNLITLAHYLYLPQVADLTDTRYRIEVGITLVTPWKTGWEYCRFSGGFKRTSNWHTNHCWRTEISFYLSFFLAHYWSRYSWSCSSEARYQFSTVVNEQFAQHTAWYGINEQHGKYLGPCPTRLVHWNMIHWLEFSFTADTCKLFYDYQALFIHHTNEILWRTFVLIDIHLAYIINS